jgi:hypothetical protein
VRRREGPGWEAAVEDEEANGVVDLGRERAEGEAPRGTEVTAALMEGGRFLCTREEVLGSFYRQKE